MFGGGGGNNPFAGGGNPPQSPFGIIRRKPLWPATTTFGGTRSAPPRRRQLLGADLAPRRRRLAGAGRPVLTGLRRVAVGGGALCSTSRSRPAGGGSSRAFRFWQRLEPPTRPASATAAVRCGARAVGGPARKLRHVACQASSAWRGTAAFGSSSAFGGGPRRCRAAPSPSEVPRRRDEHLQAAARHKPKREKQLSAAADPPAPAAPRPVLSGGGRATFGAGLHLRQRAGARPESLRARSTSTSRGPDRGARQDGRGRARASPDDGGGEPEHGRGKEGQRARP